MLVDAVREAQAEAWVLAPWGSREGLLERTRDLHLDVVHLQWPEALLTASERTRPDYMALMDVSRLLRELGRISTLALTCHNIHPHEPINRPFHKRLYEAVLSEAHTLVHHSSTGMSRFLEELPEARLAANRVVRHPPYRPSAVDSLERDAVREQVGMGGNRVWLLCIGNVAPYKRYHTLLQALMETDATRFGVLLMGSPGPYSAYCHHLLGQMREFASSGGEVRVLLEWLEETQIDRALTACDAVVACHDNSVITTGIPHLAEGHGRPVIGIGNEYLREINRGHCMLCPSGRAEELRVLLSEISPEQLEEAAEKAADVAKRETPRALGRKLRAAYAAGVRGSEHAPSTDGSHGAR